MDDDKSLEIGKDLHNLLAKHANKKGYKVEEILSWMITTLVGTMAMHNYSEQFFHKTCDRMKDLFKEKSDLFRKEKTPDERG